MQLIPINLRTLERRKRNELREFWSGLTEIQKSLVNLLHNPITK